MPIMNGVEATRIILDDSLNALTPIVAMTSNILIDDIKKYENLGMHSCLGKPFKYEDVSKLLATLFKIDSISTKETLQKGIELSNESINESLEKAGALLELPIDIMNKLYGKFLATMDVTLKDMYMYERDGDLDNLVLQAHKLKGSSSSLCFDRISEISKIIEDSVRNKKNIDYLSCINELSEQLESLQSYQKSTN